MKMFFLVVLGSAGLLVQASATDSSPVYASLKGDLVQLEGKKLGKFDESALENVKYYGVYYSAAWCGPCRAFTPKLVSWYKKTKRNNPHFELIFVSSDRSEKDMAEYMAEDKMQWPALDFSKKASNRTLTQHAGRGIPCLVLLDDQGKVLSHSYEGTQYVGPNKVLDDIDEVLAKDKPSAEAVAAAEQGKKKAGSSSFDEFFKKKPAGQ